MNSKLCLLLCLLAPAAAAGQLDEILAAHAEAVGGAQAWSRIENLRIELDISEPGFEVAATYVATRNGDMRIDVRAGGQRVFSEGLHQSQAWEWNPQSGRVAVDGQAAAALRHGIEMPGRFFTLQQVRERGANVELINALAADADAPWQLRVTLPDGFSRDHFLDRHGHRVVRARDVRAFHPSLDTEEIELETLYSGNLWTDGVLRSARSENRAVATGEWLGTTHVRSIEHNVELPEGYFAGE